MSIVVHLRDGYTIQEAIDLCKVHEGGMVIVPRGLWITGPLKLCSNLTLEVEEGAVVSFSNNPDDYLPVVFTRWEGMECYNYTPLIYASNCEYIKIFGKGKFIGNGESWWSWKKLQGEAAQRLCYSEANNIPVQERIYGTKRDALRPSFIQFINCSFVELNGFTIENGPQWTIHPVYCQYMLIKNVNVYSNGPNTDGINPDSCKDMLITGCTLSTGDDCIAINAGMNEDGWRVNKCCENIEISNCVMNGGHGGVVIGSAVSGGIKNISFHDCIIRNTNQGIRIKSMKGRGGYIHNVSFENIILSDILEAGIEISMFYPYSTVTPLSHKTTDCKGIQIKNVTGNSLKKGIAVHGLMENPIKGLKMENVTISSKEKDQVEYAEIC